MRSNHPKQPSSRLQIGSAGFAMSLIALALFVCILVPVLISCALNPAPKLTPYAGESATNTEKPPETPTDSEFVPVFAPSSVVVKPYSTAKTVTLAEDDRRVDSQYAVLMDAETGEILAGKSSNVQFSPASMTKVMTLIVACENLSQEDLERKIPFTEEIHEYVTTDKYNGMERIIYEKVNGYSTYGDKFLIKDLLYFIGIKSAADCTYMIVREICDSEADFVELMNQKAKELGLTKTVFDNVVGYDSVGNQTTAEEMAVIMSYAMQNDVIADILKIRSDEDIPLYGYYLDENGNEKSYRHNKDIQSTFVSRQKYYKAFNLTTTKLDATKTGYTNESFIVCMATSKQTGKQYVLVLGNKETDYTSLSEKFKATMIDIEYLYNQYVK